MKEQVFRISPDGKVVQTIMHNDSPMGNSTERLHVVRASHVRFDNEMGRWYVYLRTVKYGVKNTIGEVRQPQGFSTRAEALEYEQYICNELLSKNPTQVMNLIKAHDELDFTSG